MTARTVMVAIVRSEYVESETIEKHTVFEVLDALVGGRCTGPAMFQYFISKSLCDMRVNGHEIRYVCQNTGCLYKIYQSQDL